MNLAQFGDRVERSHWRGAEVMYFFDSRPPILKPPGENPLPLQLTYLATRILVDGKVYKDRDPITRGINGILPEHLTRMVEVDELERLYAETGE